MWGHTITARHLGPTNNKGSRIKLNSQRFERDALTLSYSYRLGSTHTQATETLKAMGYTILATGETDNTYIFIVKEFQPLRKMAEGKDLNFDR